MKLTMRIPFSRQKKKNSKRSDTVKNRIWIKKIAIPILLFLLIWVATLFFLYYTPYTSNSIFFNGQKAQKTILTTFDFNLKSRKVNKIFFKYNNLKVAEWQDFLTINIQQDKTNSSDQKPLHAKEKECLEKVSNLLNSEKLLLVNDIQLPNDDSTIILVKNNKSELITSSNIWTENKFLKFIESTLGRPVSITDDFISKVQPSRISSTISFMPSPSNDEIKKANELCGELKKIAKGSCLINRGEIINSNQLLIIRRHEKIAYDNSKKERFNKLYLNAFTTITALLLSVYGLSLIKRKISKQTSRQVLITAVIILQLIINYFCFRFIGPRIDTQFLLVATMPMAFGAMLLAPLTGVRVAISSAIFTSFVTSLQFHHNMEVLLIGLLSSITAALLMKDVRKRFQAITTGIGIGAVVALYFMIVFQLYGIPIQYFSNLVGLSMASGLISAIATTTILPFFEYFFSITTQVSLLELSDLNHPLLKRLQLEAPGTYHHSIMVATIAEQAAKSIGANALLARVCAYFHDIGKLTHPEYFIENNHGVNLHDDIQPRISSLVILNHIKEGLELARKYKLKKPIREAIQQHHGTSLIYFFYRKAITNQDNDDKAISEKNYRYPGPLPKRKEIAIVFLADSCEAAARSLEKPTHSKISNLVNDIFNSRIKDNQLEEAKLTFKELAIAKKNIIKTLGTMYHSRIKYPKESKDETDFLKKTTHTSIK